MIACTAYMLLVFHGSVVDKTCGYQMNECSEVAYMYKQVSDKEDKATCLPAPGTLELLKKETQVSKTVGQGG